MLNKTVLLSTPPVLEKNADGALTITTVHKKTFPVRCVSVKLRVTGDDFSAICRIRCGSEIDSQSEVTIDTTRTGVTVFEIEKLSAISLMGIFSLKIKDDKKASVLILPPPIKPANTLALPRGLVLRPKPGGGFSEEHDMRNYRQGDPVRSIHWKLSAKYNSLIIREPLVPPHHSRLVHVMPWNGADERDLILGRLRWITEYLLKWEMPFYVKFGDIVRIAEIKNESNLVDFLHCVLDDTVDNAPTFDSIPARFAWLYRIDAGTGVKAAEQDIQEEAFQ